MSTVELCSLTDLEMKSVIEQSYPKPDYHQQPLPNLFISRASNGMFCVSDWAGYICATSDLSILAKLITLESNLRGTVRQQLFQKKAVWNESRWAYDIVDCHNHEELRPKPMPSWERKRSKASAEPLNVPDISDILDL